MKQQRIFFCVCVAFASSSFDVVAATWPKLDNRASTQCIEALQIAKATFDSDARYLFVPPVIPVNISSVLVLKPQALDISGGDSLEADEAEFDKLPSGDEGAPRSIYWQKTASHGQRLVLQESSHGWRGDMYSLFAVQDETRSDEFLNEIRSDRASKRFVPIISDRWRPPLIFKENRAGRSWFIDVGQPYQFLADWQVYVVELAGIKPSCTVQLRPDVKRAVDLLPKPVRKLALLLDQTIGQGIDEGTLQPTARLRLDVQYTWANAALRPWVSHAPYNNRQEVDAGLEAWSRNGATYRKAYQEIRHLYPIAEQSLANYYQRHFGQSPSDAKKLSAFILDIGLRSHYVFHITDQNSVLRNSIPQENPWRKRP